MFNRNTADKVNIYQQTCQHGHSPDMKTMMAKVTPIITRYSRLPTAYLCSFSLVVICDEICDVEISHCLICWSLGLQDC